MRNLLKNGGFEGGTCRDTFTGVKYGEIDVPAEWGAFWKEGGVPLPHDPANKNGYRRPECKVIARQAPFLDPLRIAEGNQAWLCFTFFGIHDAGLYQQVDVERGASYAMSAKAHAWSSTGDKAKFSDGAKDAVVSILQGDTTNSDLRNFTFMVGVDVNGGVDPYDPGVVWGRGVHNYNGFGAVPEVKFTAHADRVTVFLRAVVLWPFKHCDSYWDAAELVRLDAGETPEDPGQVGGYAYPVVERGSKVGVHASYGTVMDVVRTGARPAVVKAVDDWGWLSDLRSLSPDTIVLARATSKVEGLPGLNEGKTPAQAAAEVMAVISRKIERTPGVERAIDYFELCNEPDASGRPLSYYQRLAETMVAAMELAEKQGLKLALFSMNCGRPEFAEWQAIVETGVFERMIQGGHILALHEGTLPVEGHTWEDAPVDLWHGQGIPGAPVVSGAGALAMRYRYLYEGLLIPRGAVVPLVISEFYPGYGHPAAEMVRQRFSWYDALIRQDYYVLGACPFTFGPTPDWKRQDCDFTLAALDVYWRAEAEKKNAGVPAVVPDQPGIPDIDAAIAELIAASRAAADQLSADLDAAMDRYNVVMQAAAEKFRERMNG